MVHDWISVLMSLFSVVNNNNTMSQTGYIIKKKGSFWLMVLALRGGATSDDGLEGRALRWRQEFESVLVKLVFIANTL